MEIEYQKIEILELIQQYLTKCKKKEKSKLYFISTKPNKGKSLNAKDNPKNT
jgi:hypothetical protein